MMKDPLKQLSILQVNTADRGGGAEKVAWDLHQGYRSRGYESWLAVGRKRSGDEYIVQIPNLAFRSPWARAVLRFNKRIFSGPLSQIKGTWILKRAFECIAEPKRQKDVLFGREDFDFPGTWMLLKLTPSKPHVVHFHNLHGEYFDLRTLPWISSKLPVVLTLHDAWMLSGHCAHSFGCGRWKTGCGRCPDICIYPAINYDNSHSNWIRKRDIYQKSRLYVATPSQWLMKKVKQSMLAPAILESRVIPNGVDLGVFCPGDKDKAKRAIGIPDNMILMLFVGNTTKTNPWKDFETLRKALNHTKTNKCLWLICLGEKGDDIYIGNTYVQFMGYRDNPYCIAEFYRAADIYVYPSKADTFPNTILEALACGTPIIATATGGIPEQVKGLKQEEGACCGSDKKANPYPLEKATGILVPPGDVKAMAFWIDSFVKHTTLRKRLGENARRDAQERFDQKGAVRRYLEWYVYMISDNAGRNRD